MVANFFALLKVYFIRFIIKMPRQLWILPGLIALPAFSQAESPIYNSPPFRITAAGRISDAQIRSIEHALQQARKNISVAWKWQPVGLISITVYAETWQYCQETGQPWWLGGVYQNGRIYLQAPHILEARGILTEIVTHEYAHVLIEQESANRCPRWLNEGLAVYLARTSVTKPDTLFDSDILAQRFARQTTQESLAAAYSAAHYYAAELINRHGKTVLQNWFQRLKKGQLFSESFKESFGNDLHKALDSIRQEFTQQQNKAQPKKSREK